MIDPQDKPVPVLPEDRRPITRNEILDVMADEGYSADDRKAWLKAVLTRMTQREDADPDPGEERLITEIKDILHKQVSRDTEADDTL